MVRFLYKRLPGGLSSTLIVSTVAALVVYHELSIQGHHLWVIGWFTLLLIVLFGRFLMMQRFLNQTAEDSVFDSRRWLQLFLIGAILSGALMGFGVAFVMPFVTKSAQVMLHLILLGVSVGAIAFLSTSLMVYISYLLVTLMPITLWLMSNNKLDSYILSFMTFYLMVVISLAVRHMNKMIRDSQYYRFENQLLIDDLKGLLDSVSDSNKALEKLSVTDEVTGLANYRSFRMHLEALLKESERQGRSVIVAKISIDFFYEYNLMYGQKQGDELLRQVARIIESNLTTSGQFVCRLRGAEFALLMADDQSDAARNTLEQMIDQLRNRKIEHRNSRVASHVTLSIGLGIQAAQTGTTAKHMLELADQALRLASEQGRNRIEVLNA